MLSAKLYEDKLIFIDSEQLDYPKTQLLEAILKPFNKDKICILSAANPDNDNLEMAARNLGNVRVRKPHELHVPDLLKSDYIFIPKQGLIDYEEVLESRHDNYFRNRKVSREVWIEQIKEKKLDEFQKHIINPIQRGDEDALEGYDDDKPLYILSESLKGYIDDLKRLQFQAQEKARAELEAKDKLKLEEVVAEEAEVVDQK